MKEVLLRAEDLNVILVDWKAGADASGLLMYVQPAANTQVVGAVLAKFINFAQVCALCSSKS